MTTSRTYGSVDHLLAADSSLLPKPGHTGVNVRDIEDFPSLANQDSGACDAFKRYFTLAAICGFAVSTFMFASQGDRRLAGVPGAGIGNGGSFSEVQVSNEHKPVVHTPAILSNDEKLPATSQDTRLAFTALNFYHVRDGKPGASYPWLKDMKLVEPHRETTLAVTNAKEGFDYRWEVRSTEFDGVDGKVHATGAGSKTVVVLTELDENVITLEEVDSRTGIVVRRLQETVMVKYVRREIFSLTEEERDEVMDAMLVLWKVRGDADGKDLYGDDYSDVWAMNRLHHAAASAMDCDHFHDGLGFLTSHSLLTNTFEHSLQLVNPKLALPYWDYTVETSSAYTGYDVESPVSRSPVFSPEIFGGFDPSDNIVKDGRWAFTETQKMSDNNPSGVTPDVYGKLRSPWNVNDNAYLSRGMGQVCGVSAEAMWPWPTCEMHYDLVKDYSDFHSWVWQSLYDPHGHVHIFIGGMFDCEDTYKDMVNLVGEYAASQLAQLSLVHRKNMYRDGVFTCEGTATVDEKPYDVMKAGTCGCLGYDLSQGNDWIRIYDQTFNLDYYIGDQDDDTKRQVVALLCSATLSEGDHLQSSSSLDPSFWTIYPTMERLWMYSVLGGNLEDFSWPDSDMIITESDGTVTRESISLYSDTCAGHRGSDVFPFDLLATDITDFKVWSGIRGTRAEGRNVLSNRQALQALDPRVNLLPYVYDSFSWDHCAADGFDFEHASNDVAGAKRPPSFPQGAPKRSPSNSQGRSTSSSLKSLKENGKAEKPVKR